MRCPFRFLSTSRKPSILKSTAAVGATIGGTFFSSLLVKRFPSANSEVLIATGTGSVEGTYKPGTKKNEDNTSGQYRKNVP